MSTSPSAAVPTIETDDWNVVEPSRRAFHSFFFPRRRRRKRQREDGIERTGSDDRSSEFEEQLNEDQQEDRAFVEHFWTAYDDVIILFLFTQIGILARLGMSKWLVFIDGVFRSDSALFVNLPLNCFSCFIMGLLCSGDRLMEILTTRFSPPRLYQQTLQNRVAWQPPVSLNQELRDVQLLALERRIRQSKCLLLFPVRKQDVDVMEHYFADGYRKSRHDLELQDEDDQYQEPLSSSNENGLRKRRNVTSDPLASPPPPPPAVSPENLNPSPESAPLENTTTDNEDDESDEQGQISESHNGEGMVATTVNSEQINQMVQDVSANVTENINRLQRVNLADGWDSGTTPEAMSDDLMLGLRDGFCGALSSFSSWNSSMVRLLRNGHVGEALVGYMLGIQLPIVAYRFGQHVAVYVFIFRTRHEKRRDERRGYGIRIATDGDEEDDSESINEEEEEEKSSLPSIRAVVTALFVMSLVTQFTSLSFFSQNSDDQQIALSLLFSPLGVLARWRLSKFNSWRPTFPIGTFTANILACALSGSLGQLLAGNPGPEESIVLVSFIQGFGGTLSSLATFIVEILAGIDPILFRFDGFIYAILSICWALVVGFVFSASVDWADVTEDGAS